MADITGLVKVCLSILIIGGMEMSMMKNGKTVDDWFEIAMSILFGAWILREGW